MSEPQRYGPQRIAERWHVYDSACGQSSAAVQPHSTIVYQLDEGSCVEYAASPEQEFVELEPVAADTFVELTEELE